MKSIALSRKPFQVNWFMYLGVRFLTNVLNIEDVDQFLRKVVRELWDEFIPSVLDSRRIVRHGRTLRDRHVVGDIESDKFLRQKLERKFPQVGFLTEEGPKRLRASGLSWIIDAIDGTNNFTAGYPSYATAIALADHSHVQYGLVYNPNLKEYFSARRGGGAYLNDSRLGPVSFRAIEDTLIAFGAGNSRWRASKIAALQDRLEMQTMGIRRLGCASLDLAYVAASRLSCFIHPYLKIWDRSAALLLVEEAGGTIREIRALSSRRHKTRAYVVGDPRIVAVVEELLRGELGSPDAVHFR